MDFSRMASRTKISESRTPASSSSPETSISKGDSKVQPKHHYQKNKHVKPRRNKSAFIIFSSEARAKLKADHGGDLNSNEMMVMLATMWKNLSPKERDRYDTMAREDKNRYKKELAEFAKSHPTETIHNKTRNNHVKKPCSAYGIFLKERKDSIKQDHPTLKMADILKIVSQEWKKLSPTDLKVYQDKAKVEKEETRSRLCEAMVRDQVKNPEPVKTKSKNKREKGKREIERHDDPAPEKKIKLDRSSPQYTKASSSLKVDDSILKGLENKYQETVKVEENVPIISQPHIPGDIPLLPPLFPTSSLDFMLNASLLLKNQESTDLRLIELLARPVQKPSELFADLLTLDNKVPSFNLIEPSLLKMRSDSHHSISQFLDFNQNPHRISNSRSRLNDAIISALGNDPTKELPSLFSEQTPAGTGNV